METLDLWHDDFPIDDFYNLSLEDKITSYFDSFKNIRDVKERPMIWARIIVEQHGHESVSIFLDHLLQLNYEHEFKKPYDSRMSCFFYWLVAMNKKELLTESDKQYIQKVLLKKLDEYILKYRIIDGTVRVAFKELAEVDYFFPEYIDSEIIAEYYQERLGIDDIVAGDINQLWH